MSTLLLGRHTLNSGTGAPIIKKVSWSISDKESALEEPRRGQVQGDLGRGRRWVRAERQASFWTGWCWVVGAPELMPFGLGRTDLPLVASRLHCGPDTPALHSQASSG